MMSVESKPTPEPEGRAPFSRIAAAALRLPIHAYRYVLAPVMGGRCRHMPSCSEYALDAIALNGAWRGFWLAVSRFTRCRPGGTSGLDRAPDIRGEHHPIWAAWRYGRWRARDLGKDWMPL